MEDEVPASFAPQEPRLTGPHEEGYDIPVSDNVETVFKIVMLRSGDNEWDVKDIHNGWHDSKLTAEGRQQIIEASNLLKQDNYTFDLAYCSALSRCRDSLAIILEELDLKEIETRPSWELNERHCGALTVHITNDLERKIADAFDVFDHAGNRTVDIREIGTIIRSLGCVPTEAEIQEILVETENPEATGSVHLSAFLPHMTRIFTEHKYQPATPDKLLEAFRKLDPEGLGYISKEFLTKMMMEEGEPFTEDEIEEMMTQACDPKTQTIPYEYYINQLMYDPPEEDDLYILADKIEAAKPKEKKRTVSEMMRIVESSTTMVSYFNPFIFLLSP